jgi:hypothetical protein
MTAPPDETTISVSMRLTNRMPSCRGLLLMRIVGAIAFTNAACGGSNQQTCTQGTEGCHCGANSTCNTGLTCASNTCVNLGGAGGASGAAGTTGAAGSGATAGASGGNAGGTSSTGTGRGYRRNSCRRSGGAGTGGGAGSCTANTSTDPQNCGACGHVCKSAAPEFNSYCPPGGCCAGGQCGPSFSSCLSQAQVTNCADYCASIGETCVEKGCALGGITWLAWGTENACNIFHNPSPTFSTAPCTANVAFASGAAVFARIAGPSRRATVTACRRCTSCWRASARPDEARRRA